MAERLKTADVDATNHSKLSFRGLVDILEPDGPAISTNWKSIVDRDEQVIVFFQVEYMQFIPQLSKCIRIRRDRTKQFEEILVPSVFFGRHLDDSFVEKTFGRSHLAHLSELYRLLDIVNQSEKKTNLSNDSDGEQKNDYGDSITAPTVDGDEQEMITIPQFLPSYPSNVYPRSNQLSSTTDFVITEVLPSAQISAHEDEDRESISSASEEYHRSSELSDREVRSIKKKRKTSDMEDNRDKMLHKSKDTVRMAQPSAQDINIDSSDRCEICQTVHMGPNAMKKHHENRHNPKTCRHCDNEFSGYESFRVHRKPTGCSCCGKKDFICRYFSSAHIKICRAEKTRLHGAVWGGAE